MVLATVRFWLDDEGWEVPPHDGSDNRRQGTDQDSFSDASTGLPEGEGEAVSQCCLTEKDRDKWEQDVVGHGDPATSSSSASYRSSTAKRATVMMTRLVKHRGGHRDDGSATCRCLAVVHA